MLPLCGFNSQIFCRVSGIRWIVLTCSTLIRWHLWHFIFELSYDPSLTRNYCFYYYYTPVILTSAIITAPPTAVIRNAIIVFFFGSLNVYCSFSTTKKTASSNVFTSRNSKFKRINGCILAIKILNACVSVVLEMVVACSLVCPIANVSIINAWHVFSVCKIWYSRLFFLFSWYFVRFTKKSLNDLHQKRSGGY